MHKIGFFGNGCTGKTTSSMNMLTYLKLRKLRTGYISDLCRFITFEPNMFDTHPEARLHILFKQFEHECESVLRADVEYLIMERTVLDWFLYYKWTCKNIGKEVNPLIEKLVLDWANTYSVIFYMSSKGIDYVDDGFRPASTKIRDEVDPMYHEMYEWLKDNFDGQLFNVTDSEVADRVKTTEKWIGAWINESLPA